jgi:adenylate cyclase
VRRHWIAQARVASGVVLFVFVASHLVNHSLGVVSLDAMERGRLVFLAVWRNPLGSLALYTALLVHLGLVFYSLYRRRTLRMPLWEAVQIVLGLSLPFLLATHVPATMGLARNFGLNDLYAYVLAAIYVLDPLEGAKQSLALVVAWSHGAMGLHFWLRLKPLLLADPAWQEALWKRVNLPGDEGVAWVYETRDGLLALALIAILLIVATRLARLLIERRKGSVVLSYPDGRQTRIRPGVTVLEASRLAGIPHASVCGGRGRCSTCRVRLGRGAEALPPASLEESRVLARVGAPEGVRLACQIQPGADLEVTPLLPPTAQPRDALRRPRHLQGAEREVAVLFADLRAFTRFSEGKLPFDVVFVINQYARAMGRAVEEAGGHVDKFIGDGVMALFGIESGPEAGSRAALAAARGMAAALDGLNAALESELDEPFRIGIGIHIGPVIVGEMGYAPAMSVTAIGDAVNTASRLETMTKEFGCQLVLSRDVAMRAGVDLSAFPSQSIEVRGRREALEVYVIESASLLPHAQAEAAA